MFTGIQLKPGTSDSIRSPAKGHITKLYHTPASWVEDSYTYPFFEETRLCALTFPYVLSAFVIAQELCNSFKTCLG